MAKTHAPILGPQLAGPPGPSGRVHVLTVAAPAVLEPCLYYLAWRDPDGTEGTEDDYQTLPEVTERGQDYQREVEAHGNPCGRRYEVRERVYGRVVVRFGKGVEDGRGQAHQL